MFKYHNLISLFLGLVFLGLLQTFSKPVPVFRFLLPVFLLLAFLLSIYNKKYLEHLQKYDFWVLFRPLLLISAGFGVFLFLPYGSLRIIFLLISALLIYIFESALSNFSENLLISETVIIAFGIFFAIFGMNAYFPFLKAQNFNSAISVQIFYSACVLLSVYALTRAFYSFVPQDKNTQNISALLLAFFSSQIFWALSLLPLHFSVLALLLANFYYLCLILNYYFIFNTLSAKKVYFHFLLILLTSAVALLSTPWKVV